MREHRELDALFERLHSAAGANAREDVAAAWTAVESSLRDHLAFEEEVIFRGLAGVHPSEVAELSLEHEQIRQALAAIDVEVDLHLVRHVRVDALIASLRRHAAREDALMYQWAEASLLGSPRESALTRVRRARHHRPRH